MLMKDIMCVYKIVNSVNDNTYVGSTKRGFNWRKQVHLNLLRQKKHHNRHLQRAFNLYGERSFTFEVIEVIDDVTCLTTREQHWIDQLIPVYNVMRDIKSHIGVKRSEETRKKISESLTGRKLSDAHKAATSKGLKGKVQSDELIAKRMKNMYKPIIQCDMEGNQIVQWESATHAAKALQFHANSIRRCLHGSRTHYRQFKWKFA